MRGFIGDNRATLSALTSSVDPKKTGVLRPVASFATLVTQMANICLLSTHKAYCGMGVEGKEREQGQGQEQGEEDAKNAPLTHPFAGVRDPGEGSLDMVEATLVALSRELLSWVHTISDLNPKYKDVVLLQNLGFYTSSVGQVLHRAATTATTSGSTSSSGNEEEEEEKRRRRRRRKRRKGNHCALDCREHTRPSDWLDQRA